MIERSQSYAYFRQDLGKSCWDYARSSPITVTDVQIATGEAIAELDAGFLRVRSDRLSPSERRYLSGMAELGGGPHSSGKIAHVLGRPVRSVAASRAKLIEKGMICSPAYGNAEFTVPFFDEYLWRVVPGTATRTM